MGERVKVKERREGRPLVSVGTRADLLCSLCFTECKFFSWNWLITVQTVATMHMSFVTSANRVPTVRPSCAQ